MSNATCELWTREERRWAPVGGGLEHGHQLLIPMPLKTLLIGRTNYQGSSDIIAPGLVGEDGDHWETGGWEDLRRCNHPDSIQAWAYSWYGGGSHWPTTVCLSCRVVTGRLSGYIVDYGWGYPTPEQAADDEQWQTAGWPRNGPPPGVVAFDEREDDDR